MISGRFESETRERSWPSTGSRSARDAAGAVTLPDKAATQALPRPAGDGGLDTETASPLAFALMVLAAGAMPVLASETGSALDGAG